MLLQFLSAMAGGVVLVLADSSDHGLGFVFAAAVLALEAAGWINARLAVRGTAPAHRAVAPLTPEARKVVGFYLVIVPLATAVILYYAEMQPGAAAMLLAVIAIGCLSMLRVLKRNSFLGMSWLPPASSVADSETP